GDVQRAQRPLPRTDRPRGRPGARKRPPDDGRTPARPAPAPAGRLRAAARGADRVPRRPPPAGPPLRLPRRAGRAAPPTRALAARLVPPERALGGGARPAVRLRRLHQPARGGLRRRVPEPVRPFRPPRATAGARGRVRDLRTDRRRGRAARSELARGI